MNYLKSIISIITNFIILLIIFTHQSVNAQNVDLNKYELANTTQYPSSIINDNLSGITYNEETKTLFMVQNDPTNIYEVNLEGVLEETIELVGFDDTEGIAHLGGNRFAVTEERLGNVVLFNIDANTTRVNYRDSDIVELPKSLGPPFDGVTNDGLEGLTYNKATKEIITTREYKKLEDQPEGYFVFKMPSTFPYTLRIDEVRTLCKSGSPLNDLRDLAGIHYTGNNMLVLSEGEDENNRKLLIEINPNCEEVSRLSLSNTNQPEGVTLTEDGVLYIASEKNLLYKFVKKLDCEAGQPCDDNDSCTEDDVFTNNCTCIGKYKDDDNDGVCNADDVCLVGDDNIDTDNDGIPDACETCLVGAAGNGDVNLDGMANVVDAMLVAQYEAGLLADGNCENLRLPGEICLEQADMNCDGRVNIVDALFIAQCEVGIENRYCPN